MITVRTSHLYSQVIKELNYPFGTLYIFDGYLISEINEGVHFSWHEHGRQMVEDVSCYLGTLGDNLIYISNRVNSYSVVASDWLKFFKNYYFLKGYYIVDDKQQTKVNSLIENLFFNGKIKRFDALHEAVNFANFALLNQLGA